MGKSPRNRRLNNPNQRLVLVNYLALEPENTSKAACGAVALCKKQSDVRLLVGACRVGECAMME